jgi:hypothetical protein
VNQALPEMCLAGMAALAGEAQRRVCLPTIQPERLAAAMESQDKESYRF